MRRSSLGHWRCVGIAGIVVVLTVAVLSLPREAPATLQPAPDNQLPVELQYVPTDAAVFLHADAAAIWGNPVVRTIRDADKTFIDELVGKGKDLFGLAPDDVKSVVAFVPTLKNPRELERFGVVVSLKRAYEKDKIQKGVEELLPKNAKIRVVAVNDRTALVLVNLGEEYAKPQPFDATAPLAAIIREAATGKHAAVAGVTIDNLPNEVRADDLPPPIRPFKALTKASTLTAVLDLGKSIDLEVRVKTGTAAQAVECEKALGLLLALIQDEVLAGGLKAIETDAEKNPIFKDLATLMKAAGTAAQDAKFSTLGNEARVSVKLPTDLPYARAYLAAKQKAAEAAAVAESSNNLKQLGLAMHNYHDTMNAFPPAAVCDKTGKSLLSWRVLILPYVNEEKLYKEFKLDEPWDSEHNKKLLVKMPKVYAIPGKTKAGDSDTHYRVFVGNGAGFDWIKGGAIAGISDGTSNTIMCVTSETAVPWTKPDDLEFDPAKDMTKLIGLVVNGTAQATFFDGSVRTFRKIPPRATLNALITRAGGEVIDFDFE
jgi:uncharacterized protein DUF1559